MKNSINSNNSKKKEAYKSILWDRKYKKKEKNSLLTDSIPNTLMSDNVIKTNQNDNNDNKKNFIDVFIILDNKNNSLYNEISTNCKVRLMRLE